MQKLSNVLNIELFPDKLMELTYPEKAGSDVSLSNVIPITLKKERPSSQVKDRFRKLNIEHIKYVLDELSRCKSDVAHMRAFLITLMYNAPATIDSYYTAKVNHDMMHAEKH